MSNIKVPGSGFISPPWAKGVRGARYTRKAKQAMPKCIADAA